MKMLAAAVLWPLVEVVLAVQKALALGESGSLRQDQRSVREVLRKAGRHRSRQNLPPLRRRVTQDEDRIVQTCPLP
jgi:hypothetical protein